jgi:hypothetical protein
MGLAAVRQHDLNMARPQLLGAAAEQRFHCDIEVTISAALAMIERRGDSLKLQPGRRDRLLIDG